MSSFDNEYGHELVSLIERSALGKNSGDVKGMTLFSNGNILQLLQGEEFSVAKIFHIFPLQTNQFQVLKMTEEVIETISLNHTCIGFDKTGFNRNVHADVPNSIPVFMFNSDEIGQRIPNSAGRTLSMNFVEIHP
jgi:hypothetical protein